MTPQELKQLRQSFPHGWAGSRSWYRYIFSLLLERQVGDDETNDALVRLQLSGRANLRPPRSA